MGAGRGRRQTGMPALPWLHCFDSMHSIARSKSRPLLCSAQVLTSPLKQLSSSRASCMAAGSGTRRRRTPGLARRTQVSQSGPPSPIIRLSRSGEASARRQAPGAAGCACAQQVLQQQQRRAWRRHPKQPRNRQLAPSAAHDPPHYVGRQVRPAGRRCARGHGCKQGREAAAVISSGGRRHGSHASSPWTQRLRPSPSQGKEQRPGKSRSTTKHQAPARAAGLLHSTPLRHHAPGCGGDQGKAGRSACSAVCCPELKHC